ncbi:hypothetical protein G9A89_023483 [Geosiphon pyriformis]|nr:hypothetical protein G9A89_023483 [Geosiphon pyriformis]
MAFQTPIFKTITRSTRSFARSPILNNSFYRSVNTTQITEKAGAVGKNAQNFVSKTVNKILTLQEPIIYNFKVVKETAKEVWVKEDLSPPNKKEFDIAWSNIVKQYNWLRNELPNLDSETLKRLFLKEPRQYAIYAVRSFEVFSLFVVGEIIGRRSLIGYKV